MNVLAITAHPDDLEIGCSGTLTKLQQNGACIDSVVLVRPCAEVRINRDEHTVKQELTDSYAVLGFGLSVYMTPLFDNGRPNLTCDTNTITAVSELIENKDYDLVLVPSPTDWHQDHRCAYEIGMSIFAGHGTEIWSIDSWPYCMNAPQGNIKIDITAQWQTKSKCLHSYRSYLTAQNIQAIEQINRYWGTCMGTEYAESFHLIKKHVR